MKTPSDPRHLARISAVKSLFSLGFIKMGLPRPAKGGSRNDVADKVIRHLKKIDKLISIAAPERKIDKINRIDLAILRLAVWELTIDKKNPDKAVIDEAIELAKTYGSDGSPGFVNGVLGTIQKVQSAKIKDQSQVQNSKII